VNESIYELAPRLSTKNNLIRVAEQAIAWGIPDSESTGYSRETLINIISRLVKRVKELETQ